MSSRKMKVTVKCQREETSRLPKAEATKTSKLLDQIRRLEVWREREQQWVSRCNQLAA